MSSKEFNLKLSYSMMENAVIVIHENIWLYSFGTKLPIQDILNRVDLWTRAQAFNFGI